ncbi:MAG: hypothetical protein FJX55_19575 [Alphaproteobacteria bacterium]|nr:hypothetical protein [Alphaproteobacteria bacterium]
MSKLGEWTPEIEARVEALLAEGLSTAAVAKRLTEEGFPTTKNAILGRRFRKSVAAGHVPLAKRPAPTRKGEIPPTGCRWIEGKPAGLNTVWCNAPVARPGFSYCAKHMAIAWRPAPTLAERAAGKEALALGPGFAVLRKPKRAGVAA